MRNRLHFFVLFDGSRVWSRATLDFFGRIRLGNSFLKVWDLERTA